MQTKQIAQWGGMLSVSDHPNLLTLAANKQIAQWGGMLSVSDHPNLLTLAANKTLRFQ